MKEAMWDVDRSGEFLFSDRTDPGQDFIFDRDELAIVRCADLMEQQLKGKTLRGSEVYRFVAETRYLRTHANRALGILEGKGAISVSEMHLDGTKRRSKSFKDNCVVTFSSK